LTLSHELEESNFEKQYNHIMVQKGHFLKLDNLNKEIFMFSTNSQENIYLNSNSNSGILKMNLQLIPNIIRKITSKVILPESDISMGYMITG